MGGDADVHQLAAVVRDEEEHVQRPEGEGRHSEEIRRPDLRGVVGQKHAPGLTGWPRRPTPAVAPDGAGAHDDLQLEEFAPDPLGAPQRILPRHPGDEVANLGAEAWPAARPSGLPPPEEAPTLAVPAEDRLRLDEHQVAPPIAAEAPHHEPEGSVPSAEPRVRTGTERDGKLLAKQEVLQHEVATATQQRVDRAEQEAEPFHRREAWPMRRASPTGRTFDLLQLVPRDAGGVAGPNHRLRGCDGARPVHHRRAAQVGHHRPARPDAASSVDPYETVVHGVHRNQALFAQDGSHVGKPLKWFAEFRDVAGNDRAEGR